MDSPANKQLQQLTKQLEDTTEWQQRYKLLQDLELALCDPTEPIQLSPKDLQALRSPLVAFVLDLRSTLAKKACETCTLIAEKCPVAFAANCQVFLGALLKQATTTVKVIADAAHNSLCQLMANAAAMPLGKVLPDVTRGVQEKSNTTLRKSCAIYLCLLLKERSINQLLPYFDTVAPLVGPLLRDSDPSTRRSARICFACIKLYSQTHADSIYNAADKKVKDMLDDTSFDAELELTRISSVSSSKTDSRVVSRQQSRATSPERERISSPTPSSPSPDSLASAVKSPMSKTTSAIPSSPSAGIQQNRRAARMAAVTTVTSPKTPTKSAIPEPVAAITSPKVAPQSPTPTSAPTSLDMDTVIKKLQRYSVSIGTLKQFQEESQQSAAPAPQPSSSVSAVAAPTPAFDYHKEFVRLRRLIQQTQRVLERDGV